MKNHIQKIINKIIQINKNKNPLKIKIMIRASDRYKEDVHLEINPSLNQGKLRSKEELKIQTRRQIPLFLQRINHKRSQNHEPIVRENQITVSAFTEINGYKDVEIVHTAEIYIQVMRRLKEESINKIKELTTWRS